MPFIKQIFLLDLPPYSLQITAARFVKACLHMLMHMLLHMLMHMRLHLDMFVAALRFARTLADLLGYVFRKGPNERGSRWG